MRVQMHWRMVMRSGVSELLAPHKHRWLPNFSSRLYLPKIFNPVVPHPDEEVMEINCRTDMGNNKF